MGYKKHNLYWGAYVAEEGDYIGLNNSHWVVRRHLGGSTFANDPKASGKTCLILEDNDKPFWSVMSFLGKDEVKELIKALTYYV